ncbi:MAG: anaerobic sulfite reductase subunit AsrA [Planctomycetes bacterium]|nr:anaerobic sulfite reductase subunit AsrA [Planctomycetota bacterium]
MHPGSARLTFGEFDAMLDSLAPTHRLFAPVLIGGGGRFSGTDVVRYGEIRSARQIEFRRKSDFSPKEVLFPITQTLLCFSDNECMEPAGDDRGILLFLRACDINGIGRLDEILLQNGPVADAYYERLRRKVKLVLMECPEPFENCFCVSMGANVADDYAMAVRFEGDRVLTRVRDETLAAALPPSAPATEFSPLFAETDGSPVRLPDSETLQQAIEEGRFFDHQMWKEYASRCHACGRCNAVCPTCSCFTTFDIEYEENPRLGERRRVWASCHADRFTDMAGGHSLRNDHGSRMRFKVLHKIHDHKMRFGRHMCVGCGRCDDQCPEYISFSACINKVCAALEQSPAAVLA